MEEVKLDIINEILEKNGWRRNRIVGILQDIQQEYYYLPREVLVYVSQKLKIPLSEIYSIATFYKTFSLKPTGKYLIQICLGTACHVRGASKILEAFERKLKIKNMETTRDKKYTLKIVNCLGCCAIGPVVVVNEKYYSMVTLSEVDKILNENR